MEVNVISQTGEQLTPLKTGGLLKKYSQDSIMVHNGHSTTVTERQVTTVIRSEERMVREPKVVQILEAVPKKQDVPFLGVDKDKHLNGPNQVIPSDSFMTSVPTDRVKLNMKITGVAAREPLSVPGLLRRTVELYPELTALATKNPNGTWKNITYEEYEFYVKSCAKAFMKLGLQRHHAVCILGFNSPEWFIADLAAIYAGGIATGIYTTNSPEACKHCAENSRANIIVVQDQKQLEKILKIKDELPLLKAIIQYEGKPEVSGVLSWEEVIDMGNAEDDEKLENVLETISVNECCTLVYTSGTVGNPKGVMLSHDNLTWTAHCVGSRLDLANAEDSIVSYLPLSHVAAQLMDLYVTMSYGVTVYFGDKDALKGSLINTLQEVRPTQFLGVPRVWEKVADKLQSVGSQTAGLKKLISSWAKEHGTQHNIAKMNGIQYTSFQYMLASMLVFRKVKRLLGLDRCQNFFSAAAPLSTDVKKYLMSLDIPVMEVFGMSECAGPHTLSLSSNFRLESIGKTLPGLETKIDNPDESGEGEICMRGRNVCMGYVNDPEKTEEAIDKDGWLHSGDLGKVDKEGFVYITGRIKDIIITAGGENIPPTSIEQGIQTELPCISHAVVIGDRRKFLSVLLTLKTELSKETGELTEILNPTAKIWCKHVGSSATTVSDILNGPDQKVMAAIQKGIDKVNEKAISNAQRVQKFAILPTDLSVTSGELGPTMKVKRNVVSSKFSEVIEKFYQGT